MKLTAFIEYHSASTEELCRSYQELRRQEDVIRAKLECIRREMVQRGFLPPTDRLLKFFEEAHNDKS